MEFNTEQLINDIKMRPAIWDSKSEEFKSHLRGKQWKELVNLYGGEDLEYRERKELVQTLQKKWKNIRDSYVRELRKREKNIDHNKKTYMYFNRLTFLNKTLAGTRKPTTDQTETEDVGEVDEETQHTPKPERARRRSKRSVTSIDNLVEVEVDVNHRDMFDIMLDDDTEEDADADADAESKNSNNQLDGVECFFDHETKSSDLRERDECHVFGELVAVKLRKLNPRTRSYVQHLINNTLFKAEMGDYNKASTSSKGAAKSLALEDGTNQITTSMN